MHKTTKQTNKQTRTTKQNQKQKTKNKQTNEQTTIKSEQNTLVIMETCQAYQEDLIQHVFMRDGTDNCICCHRPIGCHAHRRKMIPLRFAFP